MSFRIYKPFLMEMAECDAFANCPQGDKPGSIDCPFANYASNEVFGELLLALAGATEHHWQPYRVASPRWGWLGDGTSNFERDNVVDQHLTAYRIIDSRGMPVTLCCCLESLQRGTADMHIAAYHRQWEASGMDMSKLASVTFDCCAVMFGVDKGVATQILCMSQSVIANRCSNHRSATAQKTALNHHKYIGKCSLAHT